MRLNFTDGEWVAIQECLHDYKPRTKGEWRQAVYVGRSIGQLVQRQMELSNLHKESV